MRKNSSLVLVKPNLTLTSTKDLMFMTLFFIVSKIKILLTKGVKAQVYKENAYQY